MKLTLNGRTHEVELTADGITVDGQVFVTHVDGFGAGTRMVNVNGRNVRVDFGEDTEAGRVVIVEGQEFTATLVGTATAATTPRAPSAPRPAAGGGGRAQAAPAVKGAVTAQMTGRIVDVEVTAGQTIASGDLLLILEAMKMKNEIRSPRAGTIKEVCVKTGDFVQQGDPLVVLEE